MREVLVKLADKFDQEGKHELATAVDTVILSTAARNKAPLKDLDKDVKKDLLKFLHTVQKNMKDSMDALHEFFRRLRYFDIGDTVKEMGLDKVLKEIEKTHSCVDSASKSLFTMSYGKRPSKADLDQLADDFGLAGGENPSPLSFFESQVSQQGEEGLKSDVLPSSPQLEPESELPDESDSRPRSTLRSSQTDCDCRCESPWLLRTELHRLHLHL